MSPAPQTTRPADSPSRRGGVALRGALAVAGLLAVVGGAAGGAPLGATALAGQGEAPVVEGAVLRVDPAACAEPTGGVVCTPAQAAAAATDGVHVVLAPGVHAGPLDLRGLLGVTVTGEPGAVLDAGPARYALSLRDATDMTVRSLTLRGGTAQTVWLERTTGTTLQDLEVEGGAGAGVQVRDSAGLRLTDSAVRDAAAAGVMELTGVTGSAYERLLVEGNGHGPATYNGDGLQLAGSGVTVTDVVTRGNGSSNLYEHGVYVAAAARDVRLVGLTSSGNSGVAVKLGGSGTLEASALADDRLALYCGTTADGGWQVRQTTLDAPRGVAGGAGCRLAG